MYDDEYDDHHDNDYSGDYSDDYSGDPTDFRNFDTASIYNPEEPDTSPAPAAALPPPLPLSTRAPAPVPAPALAPPPSLLYSLDATVPGLFARRSINIIVGDAKTGRLRFALTHLNTYADPENPLFLDHPVSRPVQLGCLLCLRDDSRTFNDIRGMALSNLERPGVFPTERWYPSKVDESEPLHFLKQPYDLLSNSHKGRIRNGPPHFILIENLQLLLHGDTTKEKDVVVFLDLLREFCNDKDVTILGTVGTPKMQKGTSYSSHCQRIRGASVWAEGADTVISIEEARASSKTGLTPMDAELYRRVTLIPPGQPRSYLWTRFTLDGQLPLVSAPQAEMITGQGLMDQMLDLVEPNAVLSRSDFMSWGAKAGSSGRTVDRWIAACVRFNLLQKNGSGPATTYTKSVPN